MRGHPLIGIMWVILREVASQGDGQLRVLPSLQKEGREDPGE
jgi:hypothetical protein